jgi:hypothetical protein
MELSSLISEILKMAQESQRDRQSQQTQGRFSGVHWVTGGEIDRDEEENRKRRLVTQTQENAMQTQATGHENAITLERLKQKGNIAEREIQETGATARQRLVKSAQETVATTTAVGHVKGLETANIGHIKGAEVAAQGIRDVATINLGQAGKDPASAFIHESIKGDPSIATDQTRDKLTGKTRWETLLENSRLLKPQLTPVGSTPESLINKYFDKRGTSPSEVSSAPVPVPAPAPSSLSSRGSRPLRGALIVPSTPEEDYAKTYEASKSATGVSLLRSPEAIKRGNAILADQTVQAEKDWEEQKKRQAANRARLGY